MPDVLSANASRVQNPDGSFTTTVSTGKVWFKESGVWKPVDIEASSQVAGDIVFKSLVDGVKLTLAKDALTYTLERQDGSYVTYVGPAATFVDVQDNVVNYVLPSGEAFRFMLTRTGVKALTKIAKVLDKAPTWRMEWDAGLDPTLDKKGSLAYVFKDSGGETAFSLLQPVIYPGSGDMAEIRSGDVTLEKATGSLAVILSEVGLTKPFLVDPTSTFNPAAGDGDAVRQVDTGTESWATQRAGAGTAAFYTVAQRTTAQASNNNGGFDQIRRGFFPFDTSSLADNADISAVTLELYEYTDSAQPNGSSIVLIQGNQASTTEVVASDYQLAGYATSGGSALLSSFSTGAYGTITANATGRGWISKTGYSKLGVTNSMDTDNSAPGANSQDYLQIDMSEAANPPKLNVTFTIPESGDGGRRKRKGFILGLP